LIRVPGGSPILTRDVNSSQQLSISHRLILPFAGRLLRRWVGVFLSRDGLSVLLIRYPVSFHKSATL